MPAIPQPHALIKRANFASREPGVILVFCIIASLVILLIGIMVHKRMKANANR